MLAAGSDAIPFAKSPAGLQSLVRTLLGAAQKKDSAVVYRFVAPDYHVERDFGGSFDPKAGAIENFSLSFQFDESKIRPEYQGIGWREFRAALKPAALERKSDGQLCMPYGAMDADPLPKSQLCFRRTNDRTWLIAGHINGGD